MMASDGFLPFKTVEIARREESRLLVQPGGLSDDRSN